MVVVNTQHTLLYTVIQRLNIEEEHVHVLR